ncbi:MAG: pyruvate dehydrogenase (acetyl-transferring), homodimeric type [Spirochaeta sp.]
MMMGTEEYRRIEDREWLESLDYVLQNEDPERVEELFRKLHVHAQKKGVVFHCLGNTPYINTIAQEDEEPFPGSLEIERRIKSIIRWNAMAMVVRANRESSGIGGHISSYASVATLWEIGFNHFFRGKDHKSGGDIVYFQGHSSPGVYARAFVEGRLPKESLENFRREREPGGLSSYPHPRLMPDFWEFPTVSMGLSPIMAIYQARFNRYLIDQGLKKDTGQKVWALVGDGEMDEPEAMGAINLAAKENLDNLIFVVNCNLQRLDGPVRGNGQIMQELEAAFRGAGWNVIKVVWGSEMDNLLAEDDTGVLAEELGKIPDGKMQKFAVEGGAYIREHFFNTRPELKKLVENYSDEQLGKLKRGGHDPLKVYNAYKRASEHTGSPTVILAQTVKGYGLGEAGEGRNVTHQQKKLNEQELMYFRSRFSIPISDDDIEKAPFYLPDEDSEEMQYLQKRRSGLGGYLPERRVQAEPIQEPDPKIFEEFMEDSGDREIASTMAFVKLLSNLLKDSSIGDLIVPIIPDEARTFGMDALFRKVGIYSSTGQQYEPVDADSLLYYNEKKDGTILEEGISEAGSMSSFIAAGTAYATHGINTIPFFTFYSMFGFQRIGDLIWAACDARARGFLIGGTSGRTTLSGEGLQHQDGQSHLYAYAMPSVKSYDPAFAYEIAIIVQEGIRRMYVEQEDLIYYITVMNEFYPMPAMPEGVKEGILKGLYRFKPASVGTGGKGKGSGRKAHLFGSGTILRQALQAQQILEEEYKIPADVWSVTSYKELHMDALDADRQRMRHPEKDDVASYLERTLAGETGVYVAASDYVKALPASVAKWIPGRLIPLGTDGYGLSDTREALRDFFEVDARHIAYAALYALHQDGEVDLDTVKKAQKKLKIDPDTPNPVSA